MQHKCWFLFFGKLLFLRFFCPFVIEAEGIVMLEVNHITKIYNRREQIVRALDNVSLTVEPGELVMIEGPSGSGKTTLLLAAGALLAPDAGRILIAGRDPYELSPDDRAALRASTVGFVFQQFHLVPYLSVFENILVASLAKPSPQAHRRVSTLIEQLHLTDRSGHLPGELSTGERQRTALARALLNRPKLLLADEPTGNLDRNNAGIVLGFLADFAHSGGAVLLVTHNTPQVGGSHRTQKLDRGRFVDA